MIESNQRGTAPRQRRFQPRTRLTALAGALLLVLAACGGNDSETATGGSTAAEGSGTGAAATGEPIKVMVEALVDSQILPYPNIPETAKTFAKYINAKGGIKGRPLEVIVCDDRADAGEAANCARKAVEEKVVANVGSFTLDVSQAIPIYEENSIAWFGICCPVRDQEFNSKISFPMGFTNALPVAAAIKMIDDGCKNISCSVGDDTSAAPPIAAFENGLKSKGKDPSKIKIVKVPLTPGDYSTQAAQLNTPPTDCFYGHLSQVNWPPMITAFDGVGAKPKLYGAQGNLDQTIVKTFPKQTEGAIVVGVYPSLSAPVWADFRGAIEKFKPNPELNYDSLAGLGTWTGFTAFAQIVETMDGEINNVTFLAAANKQTKLDTGGMVGVLDLTKEWTGGGGKVVRIFNRSVFYDVVKAGTVVPFDGKAYDMTNAYDGKPG